MPKEEWGTKRICPHCATRFYDLKADPMICPACDNQFTIDSLTDSRGKAVTPEKNSARSASRTVNDDDEDISDDSNDLDDDLLEDDDDDDGDVSLDEIADVASDDED